MFFSLHVVESNASEHKTAVDSAHDHFSDTAFEFHSRDIRFESWLPMSRPADYYELCVVFANHSK